jgi:hypothetical protein
MKQKPAQPIACKNFSNLFRRGLQKAAATSDKITVPNPSGQLPLRNPVDRFEIFL